MITIPPKIAYIKNKHTACGYSLFTDRSFDSSKSKHGFYRGEDSMKKFFVDLRDHTAGIIICKKGNVTTDITEKESYQKQKNCHICKIEFKDKFDGDENYCKVREQSHYIGKCKDAAHSVFNLKYEISLKLSVVLRNRSNYITIVEEFDG